MRVGDVTVCYKLYVDRSWNLFNFRNDSEIEVIQQKMNEYLLLNLDSLSKRGSVAKRCLIFVKKRRQALLPAHHSRTNCSDLQIPGKMKLTSYKSIFKRT